MADGKWIDDLNGRTEVAFAARRVLDQRLSAVRNALPLAVHQSEQNIEHVHQLRVATRRAGAALIIFERWLPEKIYRQVRRKLRVIRRAAGEARDWDVFVAELVERQATVSDREAPGVDFLIGLAAGHRDEAQHHLREAGERQSPRLRPLLENTLAAIRSPDLIRPVHTLGDLGRVLLEELTRELDFTTSQNLDDYEHLHQVRILGKQLRYAMEIVAGCFPASLRAEIYPRIEEMQEILGRANDSHVAGVRLGAIREKLKHRWPDTWKRYQLGIEGLLRFHRRRLPRERDRFLKWLQLWRDVYRGQFRALILGEQVSVKE